MNNYVVLDLENPNSRCNSVCAIAVLVIKNNKVIQKKYSLINPEDRFDQINSKITNIDSSKVLTEPTLKEYWKEINSLLTENIVIGHNVLYDLNVLAKALDRYDIEAPSFRYIDTLKLSQQYLKLDSYKLESLAKFMNINYNPHNALEDTLTTYKLFDFLNQKYSLSVDDIFQKYEYILSTNDKLDSKLSTNINQLYGIIQGINYDNTINEKEIDQLNSWLNENKKYKHYSLFNRIIIQLEKILEDNIISEYEKLELIGVTTSIDESKIYNETTLGMQILQGIIQGISCDNKIVIEEIEKLRIWLNKHDYLVGIYPYDKILLIVDNVLKDNILTEGEKETLLLTFDEILNPIKEEHTNVELNGKIFCLSGEFANGSKDEIKKKLESFGAIAKSGVSLKVDYLFVGSVGSDAWKYGNIGGKIAKAQELQEKGSKIQIISENELFEKVFNFVEI